MTRRQPALWLLATAVCVATAACSRADSLVSAQQAPGSGRPPVAVDITPATPCDFTDAIDVVGSLAPKVFADVKSEVSGTVSAVYVTEWLPVKAGAMLARLDTSEGEAAVEALRAAAAQAAVGETRARREHERALQLEEYGLITPQALDDARSALEAAEAAVAAARAQIRTAEARLAKSAIRAPMDGVVALRSVNVGDRVENMGSAAPMFRIVDNRLLELTVHVPSEQLSRLRVGEPLEFTTDAIPNRTFTGTVTFVNPAVDEASRSVRVVAHVKNDPSVLKGGLFVKGRIVTETRTDVVQVASDALVNWNVAAGTAHVFVVRDGRAEKRMVRTGAVTGAVVEVIDGIAPGEPVVTRGSFALEDGDRVLDAGRNGHG